MDLTTGKINHLPHSGGVMEQNDLLIQLMMIARRAWVIWGYKPKNQLPWDESDAEFIDWALRE